jgi:hypothetical protein
MSSTSTATYGAWSSLIHLDAIKRRSSYVALAFTVLLIGCDSSRRTTTVQEVLEHPEKYVGHEVTLSGKVTKNLKLPLLPGIYWVADGTGEIPVITQGPTPLNAAELKVMGRVEYVASFGATSVGLHVAELRRH